MNPDTPFADRKPRIALLGEFSAGKSTLANALLGRSTSPVRVTATQVPPIWYTHGDAAPMRVARDGTETELATMDLGAIPVAETRVVRVSLAAEILEKIDILDMPGSSDPNMGPDIWDALLPLADLAIWCTPATQAWRQSEAAIWEGIPEHIQDRSLLLLTRIDKVANPRDQGRVLQRVARETDGQFRGVFPVSLLQAVEAPGDPKAWAASGLEDVLTELNAILHEQSTPEVEDASAAAASLRRARAVGGPMLVSDSDPEPQDPREPTRPTLVPVEAPPTSATTTHPSASVIPRRVSAPGGPGSRRRRPENRRDGAMI